MNRCEQPYERFLACGAGALTNAELLAVILRTGTAGTSAVSLGEKILSLGGGCSDSFLTLYDLTMRDLMNIRGIGQVKAVKILCLSEIARRFAGEARAARPDYSTPSFVAERYMEELRHEKQEKTLLVHLDGRLRLIGEDVLTVGTDDKALISPRDVFRKALERRALRIILLHNHPSGDPSPSEADLEVTRKIREAGELLGIPLIDHVIIGDLRYYSMHEHGIL